MKSQQAKPFDLTVSHGRERTSDSLESNNIKKKKKKKKKKIKGLINSINKARDLWQWRANQEDPNSIFISNYLNLYVHDIFI